MLGDFGIAKWNKSPRIMSTVIGTPEYCAPEVGFGLGGSRTGYTLKCDIWSVGVITHLLLTGISPFFDEADNMKTALNARAGILFLNTPEWKKVTSEGEYLLQVGKSELTKIGKAFVERLLKVNPEERPSTKQCFDLRWIAKYSTGLEKIYKKRHLAEWESLRSNVEEELEVKNQAEDFMSSPEL